LEMRVNVDRGSDLRKSRLPDRELIDAVGQALYVQSARSLVARVFLYWFASLAI